MSVITDEMIERERLRLLAEISREVTQPLPRHNPYELRIDEIAQYGGMPPRDMLRINPINNREYDPIFASRDLKTPKQFPEFDWKNQPHIPEFSLAPDYQPEQLGLNAWLKSNQERSTARLSGCPPQLGWRSRWARRMLPPRDEVNA